MSVITLYAKPQMFFQFSIDCELAFFKTVKTSNWYTYFFLSPVIDLPTDYCAERNFISMVLLTQ